MTTNGGDAPVEAEEETGTEEVDLGWEEPRKKVTKPRKSATPTEEELAQAEGEARVRLPPFLLLLYVKVEE